MRAKNTDELAMKMLRLLVCYGKFELCAVDLRKDKIGRTLFSYSIYTSSIVHVYDKSQNNARIPLRMYQCGLLPKAPGRHTCMSIQPSSWPTTRLLGITIISNV